MKTTLPVTNCYYSAFNGTVVEYFMTKEKAGSPLELGGSICAFQVVEVFDRYQFAKIWL